MSVVVWRIIQRKFATLAFTGKGARLFGGRWNSPGHAVVYTAQSLALAALEILVHVDSDKLLQNSVAIPVIIDPQLTTQVEESELPNNWRAYPASKATRSIAMRGFPALFFPCYGYRARSFPPSTTSF